MSKVVIGGIPLTSEIVVVLVYILWVTGLFILKRISTGALRRFAQHTKTPLDDIFIESIQLPLIFLILTSGGFAVVHFLPLEIQPEFMKSFLVVFKAVAILAVVLFANKSLQGLLREYSPRLGALRDASGVVRGIIRAVVFGLGLLILLDSFGISITPIIASLGITSLAIALALQPTLENLFAGIQVIMDKPIQVGHFIRLESGEEGYVEKIDWRTTWIRLPPNNVVILQNKNLVNSKITNYYYPNPESTVTVDVGVHYDSDLEKVENVTLEVARQVLREVKDAVPDFEPALRYQAFGDFSINFTVVLRVKEISQAGLLKHEFIKRLHKRYTKEGIVIPYPVQAVNYAQEKADAIIAKRG